MMYKRALCVLLATALCSGLGLAQSDMSHPDLLTAVKPAQQPVGPAAINRESSTAVWQPGGGAAPVLPRNDFRQGGDACSSARVIPNPLPYSDSGTTVGFAKDYSQAACGYGTGPDVVYAYTPSTSQSVTISLCGSGDENDTVLWVYRGNCDTNPIACNDDAATCGNLNSQIDNVPMVAGTTYYIVIAGYAYTSVNYVINVTGVPLVTGACCFCNGTCIATSAPDCADRAGTYNGDGTSCSNVQCTSQRPPNDRCQDVTPVPLQNGVPQIFTGNNACATNDCGQITYGQVWIAFTTTETADLDIEYCGTPSTHSRTFVWLFDSCPCGAAYYSASNWHWNCPDGSNNFHGTWTALPAGTYYYPVLMSPGESLGAYSITVTETVPAYGACCLCDGSCTIATAAQCAAQYGSYVGDDTTCAEAHCTPVPPPVNNDCASVQPVTLQNGVPQQFTGDTRCATANCPVVRYGVVWHAFTLEWPARVSVDYCGTTGFTNFYWVLVDGCPCARMTGRDTYSWKACGDGNLSFGFNNLAAGTYYLPVMADPVSANGPYTVSVTATQLSGGGACCLCDGSCTPANAASCAALDGIYQGDGTDCASTQCAVQLPPNAHCDQVTPAPLTPGVPLVFHGNSHCGSSSCGLLAPYGQVWEAFTLSHAADVTLTMCGTDPDFNRAYVVVVPECPCSTFIAANTYNWDTCSGGDTNITMTFSGLAAGTYYYPVMYSPEDQANGPYVVTVSTPARICRGDMNCDGHIGFDDINPFVLALSDLSQWQATYRNCPVGNVDCNSDGLVNFGDINFFVDILSGGGTCR